MKNAMLFQAWLSCEEPYFQPEDRIGFNRSKCVGATYIMEASLELNLIDPKINLRVNKDTSIELLEFGTLMTKQGLGFPQYNNVA